MKESPSIVSPLLRGIGKAAAIGGSVFFVGCLVPSSLAVDEAASPVAGNVSSVPGKVRTRVTIRFQLTGFGRLGIARNMELNREGYQTEQTVQSSYQGAAKDGTATEVTTTIKFGPTAARLMIKEDPGPDRTGPYEVTILFPYLKSLSGTKNDTSYDIAWGPVIEGQGMQPGATLMPLPSPDDGSPTNATTNSMMISETEAVKVPHDLRLEFDIEYDPESSSYSWMRLRAKTPEGDDADTLRISVIEDPKGILSMPDAEKSELRIAAAPYLPDSVEKTCGIQKLERSEGTVYYCILTDARPASLFSPTGSRFLLLGVFKVGHNVAFAFGNLSERDDANFRMLMETLSRISVTSVTQ